MRRSPLLGWQLLGLLLAISMMVGCAKKTHVAQTAPPPQPPLLQGLCDDSLWQHVYAGRFGTAQNRLKVIESCITVTGTIVNAVPEADGDFHIRVALDPAFTNLLNSKNVSEEHGYLVVEPVCENPVTQVDTLREAVCSGFSQNVFTPDMVGRHVAITGAYVTDMEHGWNEIHPVTHIVVQ